MNYQSLVAQIIAYANRSDATFTSQIDNLITQGINRIYSQAPNIGFQLISDFDININQSIIEKPAFWKETISLGFTITGANPFSDYLLSRSYEFCRIYWRNINAVAPPLFYADFTSTQFFISPTADKLYNMRHIYLSVPLFNALNPTNFLTLRYPSLLLYACMIEVVMFLKDDELVSKWEASYNRELTNIIGDTKKLYTDRIVKRDKE